MIFHQIFQNMYYPFYKVIHPALISSSQIPLDSSIFPTAPYYLKNTGKIPAFLILLCQLWLHLGLDQAC